MSIEEISEVEFGEELPTFTPDTSLETGSRFAEIAWGMRAARFSSHEKAKEEGLPAAMIPRVEFDAEPSEFATYEILIEIFPSRLEAFRPKEYKDEVPAIAAFEIK